MNQKTKKEKEFDTVKIFREIKDKISLDIKDMNFEQLNAYLQVNNLYAKKCRM